MRNIQIIKDHNISDNKNAPLLEEMFRLRGEVFNKRLGWEVKISNGLEKDNFDKQTPSYITMSNNKNNIIGCWRALPTTNKYMLKDVFPQLLRGETPPEDSNIFEISRFAISKNRDGKNMAIASEDTASLVRSFYTFAIENNITDYVLVTTVACERILKYLGVTMRRMGDGKSMQVGIEKSVALWIKVDDNLNIAQHH
ncbi:acyl-homoserine-lactone synthase [Shewanella salipaludis]|uniref:Acyl-homoserine-lactone synthase n=1 Tax=Shewanella salipaludis TaxID=2723052 RepID=A0A972FV36_9GAMM|nr:acyl-homoserine-lactone synthase [Shewanella salipaludis]NMH66670.1 GNAT family N-acetyltransferase [Shewanella salipaludis]